MAPSAAAWMRRPWRHCAPRQRATACPSSRRGRSQHWSRRCSGTSTRRLAMACGPALWSTSAAHWLGSALAANPTNCRQAWRSGRCRALPARRGWRCGCRPMACRCCTCSTCGGSRWSLACRSIPFRCRRRATTARSTARPQATHVSEPQGRRMELGLHPGIIFALALALFLVLHVGLRWPLPLAFLVVAVAAALLGDFGIPFRHLVEGGFGFINLVLALFAGAFFGHMMRASGAADAAAAGIVRAASGKVLPVLTLVAVPLFVVGMFVGLSGVAVLSGGVFAVPALRRLGYEDATIAAFIAVMATAGMIAPPMNVPAILIASGVDMPWTNVARPLLALSVPLALAALAWFRWGCGPTGPSAVPAASRADGGVMATLRGLVPLAVIVAIWLAVRAFPNILIDPASPLILV